MDRAGRLEEACVQRHFQVAQWIVYTLVIRALGGGYPNASTLIQRPLNHLFGGLTGRAKH
jgi:hypothetical protein